MAGKNKRTKRILGGIVSLCLSAALVLSPAVVTVYAADDIDTLKQKQAAYAQQKQANDTKLSQLRQDKSKKEEYKQTLQVQITTLQNQIDTYNTQISELDNNILQAQNEIADKQTSITADTKKLKNRLCALYMSGGASNLEILLSASSVADLSDKAEALQMVTSHDTALIDTLKSEMAAVSKQKKQIEKNREEVANAKTALDEKQSELSSLVSEAQSVINGMSSQESSLQAASDALAKEEGAASAAVDQWYAAYQASQKKKQIEAAQEKAAQQKAVVQKSSESNASSTKKSRSEKSSDNSSDDTNSYSSHSQDSGASASGSGSMTWPVPSCTSITSPFGHRSSPGGIGSTYHKGVDISGGGIYGAPIVAADSGTIVQAGDNGWGYGNLVIIDHGNGIMTYYGHMSSVAVGSGQTVAKGQVIGYVGSTGHSTGPHCHFEVRVNGTAVDPRDMCK